jgi:hypothetical protein
MKGCFVMLVLQMTPYLRKVLYKNWEFTAKAWHNKHKADITGRWTPLTQQNTLTEQERQY